MKTAAIILTVVILVVIAGAAIAQTGNLWSGTGDMTIVSPGDILAPVTVYMDENMSTQYINPWHWGDITAGDSRVEYLYVMNNGMEPVHVLGRINTTFDSPVTMDIIATESPFAPILIIPGDCKEFQIGVVVDDDAEDGRLEPFEIVFLEVEL